MRDPLPDRRRLFSDHVRRADGRRWGEAQDEVVRFLVCHGFAATALQKFCGANSEVVTRMAREEGVVLQRTGRPPSELDYWIVERFAHVWGSHLVGALTSLLHRYGSEYVSGVILRDAIAVSDYVSGSWDTFAPHQRAIRILQLVDHFETRRVGLVACETCGFEHLKFSYPITLGRGLVSYGEACPACAEIEAALEGAQPSAPAPVVEPSETLPERSLDDLFI